MKGNDPRRWKRYPEYKDSGVEWLGNIPKHWEVKRLKFLADFTGGGTPSKDNSTFWNGSVPWVSPKDMKARIVEDTEDHITEDAVRSSSTRTIAANSVLIVVRSGILKHSIPVAINSHPVALSQDMKAVLPRSKVLSGYIAYFIDGHQKELLVEWHKQGATVDSLEFELIANTPFPMPISQEQGAITAFLDRETSKIDSLIAKKGRLIELLQEKRAALISHAVTKGLDPNVPMKNSGVEWLGSIPAAWRIMRLKFCLFGIEQGWSPSCENRPAEFGEWGVLKVGCVNGNQFNSDEQKALPQNLEPIPELEIKPGDVLMSRANTRELLGSASVVGNVRPRLLLCDKLYRLRVRPDVVDSVYLVLALGAGCARYQMEREATGASGSMQNIAQNTIWNLWLPLPKPHEQAMILNHLDDQTSELDALIAKVRQAIDRLREYRTALISAAVTGKIDVRDEV